MPTVVGPGFRFNTVSPTGLWIPNFEVLRGASKDPAAQLTEYDSVPWFFTLASGLGNELRAPDAAKFSPLSTFSFLYLAMADDWTSSVPMVIGQRDTAGSQRSWFSSFGADGVIFLNISFDGSASSSSTATASVPFTDRTAYWMLGRRNGTTGDVDFWYAPFNGTHTIPQFSEFTQLGATVSGLTGTLKDSTAGLEIGNTAAATGSSFQGRIYRASVYTGLFGSGSEVPVLDMNANDGAIAGSTFPSRTTNETWTRVGTTTVDRHSPVNLGDVSVTAATSAKASLTVATFPTTGLVGWYDASDAASVLDTAGATNQWTDKSGNGNHLTGSGGSRPTTGTRTLNGLNVLDFDGLDWLRKTSFSFAVNTATVYLVFQADVGTAKRVLSMVLGAAADWSTTTGCSWCDVGDGGTFYNSSAVVSGGAFSTRQALYTAIRNGTAWTGRKNFKALTGGTSVSTAFGPDTLAVGEMANASSQTFDGVIAEVLVFNVAHDVATRVEIEDYLLHKWFSVKELAGKAGSSSSAQASLTIGRPPVVLDGKAAVSLSAKSSQLNRSRPVTAKAGVSDSAKASLVNRARPASAKAATSTSAKATPLKRAAGVAAKLASSASAKAVLLRRNRPAAGRSSTASSAKATTLTVGRPPVTLSGKAATAQSAKASLSRTKPLSAKAAAASSAKATPLRRGVGEVAKVASAASAKAVRIARARPASGKSPASLSTKASVRSTRRLAGKAANASGAKATLSKQGQNPLFGKTSTASNAKATSLRIVKRLGVKVPTSTGAKALVAAVRRVSTKVSATTSSKATALRGRSLQGKLSSSSGARATAPAVARRAVVRVAAATDARATARLTAGLKSKIPISSSAEAELRIKLLLEHDVLFVISAPETRCSIGPSSATVRLGAPRTDGIIVGLPKTETPSRGRPEDRVVLAFPRT